MVSSTVENYLKRLFLEQQRNSGKIVAMGKLAGIMEVSPGTATSMVKVLARSGLVDYRQRSGCRLTSKGEELALHVLRRHRLVELFLVQVLGLDWSEIHEEAERLEHAVSEKVLEKMDQYLDYPSVDPHGDPIPSANGEMANRSLKSLSSCTTGEKVTIARIIRQDTEFLKMAERHDLIPGKIVSIDQYDPNTDAMSIKPDHSDLVTLGVSAASKILVEIS